MNINIILQKLKSSSPDDRYQAAKVLAGTPISSCESEINIAHEKETVGYIKNTLAIALSRLKLFTPKQEDNQETDESGDQKSYQNGMNEMASIFLHELESVVGRIDYTANKEIENFNKSETLKHIEKLKSIIHAITELRQVHKSKNTSEINIERYLKEIVEDEFHEKNNFITLSGNKSIFCNCDKNLLGLAIINGLRNAIEACEDSQKKMNIVVRWGETNVDWYICIIDNGLGLKLSIEELKKRSVTTKTNHLGYGLLIINNAIERIDGHWSLENDAAEGANLTLRWNK